MSFDTSGPIDGNALAAARAFLDTTLPDVPAGTIDRIYLHWVVAPFHHEFDDYNAEIDLDAAGTQWNMIMTHDPRDNARGVNNNPVASHTYRRNTGAVGISVAGMDGATFGNFGPDPIQMHELEFLCACAAAFAQKYDVQADAAAPMMYPGEGRPDREHTIMTHAEAALTTPSDTNAGHFTHYYCFKAGSDPDCRWDLAATNPQSAAPTEDEAFATGELLRQRIRQYKVALQTV
jgi:hypothetical protein